MQDLDRPVFPISVVAQMLGVHPQTLRLYERVGLISPGRTKGKTRLYSQRDLDRLRVILHFTQDLGVNLAGVGLLLEMQEKIHEVQSEMWRVLERWRSGLEREDHDQANIDVPDPPQSTPRKTIKVKIERG